MSWVNLNSLANPDGKLCTSCRTTLVLSSVFSIQFFSLNSSSRLQNTIPGKMSCSILLSVIPSFSNASVLIPAAKWIQHLDLYSYFIILGSFSRYSVSEIQSIISLIFDATWNAIEFKLFHSNKALAAASCALMLNNSWKFWIKTKYKGY